MLGDHEEDGIPEELMEKINLINRYSADAKAELLTATPEEEQEDLLTKLSPQEIDASQRERDYRFERIQTDINLLRDRVITGDRNAIREFYDLYKEYLILRADDGLYEALTAPLIERKKKMFKMVSKFRPDEDKKVEATQLLSDLGITIADPNNPNDVSDAMEDLKNQLMPAEPPTIQILGNTLVHLENLLNKNNNIDTMKDVNDIEGKNL